MTKEFMDDFGIADMQDAAQWTMNVDLPNFGGDGPFGGNRNEFNIRGAGVGGAYPIRDGVTQFFVADGYNSERFEVVSGPNAGLAGSGNSGGLVASSSKRLRYNSVTTSVRTRLDSFGGYRGELDYNFAKDRFGVRVNALHQNVKNVQKGVELKQNAITLRAELKLTRQDQPELPVRAKRGVEHPVSAHLQRPAEPLGPHHRESEQLRDRQHCGRRHQRDQRDQRSSRV